MSKGFASEMILTIGILVATVVLLIQLKSIFNVEQKVGQMDVIDQFASDIQNIVGKSISTTGSAAFNYQPSIKKYTIGPSENVIVIHDKLSGKNISFVIANNDAEIIVDRIEDSENICIKKVVNKQI